MRRTYNVIGLGAALLWLLSAGSPLWSAPQSHPQYFHIISELQQADQMLGTPMAGANMQKAHADLQLAIADCRTAAHAPAHQPPSATPKSTLSSTARMQQANAMMHDALTALTGVQDGSARATQIQAINHVTGAMTYLHQAMVNSGTGPVGY